MFDSANVLVYRNPVRDFVSIEWSLVVVRVAISKVVPGRIDEGLLGVRGAGGRPAGRRARNVDERRALGQWGTNRVVVQVCRKHDRKLVLRHRHNSAFRAVDEWY